jgi:hypothetical protein
MEGRGKSQTGHSVVSYSTADLDSNGDIFSGGATNLHSKQPPMDLPVKDIGLSLEYVADDLVLRCRSCDWYKAFSTGPIP